MMMLRVLSFAFVIGLLSTSDGFAMLAQDVDNTSISKKHKSRKQKFSEIDTENIPPPSFVSPENTSPEKGFLSPIRRTIVKEKYDNGGFVTSPFIRKVLSKEILQPYYTYNRVNDKTVYQRDELFDINARVLNLDGTWKTNLERMRRGLCPIGHKGIATEQEIHSL